MSVCEICGLEYEGDDYQLECICNECRHPNETELTPEEVLIIEQMCK
jgi:hypothetical protein